jgi:leucyl aminopeptidase
MRVLFIALLVLLSLVFAEDSWRLIETSPTEKMWMRQSQVTKFKKQLDHPFVGFMDITDAQNLDVGITAAVSPIPAKPRKQLLVRELIQKVSKDSLTSGITTLSTEFLNRYYTSQYGLKAAYWIKDFCDSIVDSLPAERRRLFNVTLFHHKFLQPSIVVTMKGKSDTVGDEIAIIGGHEDSIVSYGGPDDPAPGADDNASGTMGVLEVFRVIAQSDWVPDRSLQFHTYAAEEVGLRGSQDVVQSLKSKNAKVYSYVNLDMIGWLPPSGPTVGVITDYSDRDLTRFLKQVITEYTNLPVGDTSCGYGCSDHASYTKAGYRSCFAIEGYPMSNYNKKIHTAQDKIEHISMDRAKQYTQFALAMMIELGSEK